MFIDTHTHLFYPNFDGDVDKVIERAVQAGVDYMIVPGTNLATSLQAIELAEKYNNIYASVGVHPHDSKEWDDLIIEK
ncbi:MAG: TatD family hydrolase, partial [Bacteroidota bacterium]